MKKTFPGYDVSLPGKEEISVLWKEWVFTPDANVLLGLYDLDPQVADELIGILDRLSDRGQLWISHQAAVEYHRKRPGMIAREVARQNKARDNIRNLLSGAIGQLDRLREERRAPFEADEETSPLIENLRASVNETRDALENAKQDPLDALDADRIRAKIASAFDDRVGPEYPPEKLNEMYERADRRFALGVRPGFRDARKGGVKKYGDAILWFQLIDYAKETKRPIVFVTDDEKDDWWLKAGREEEIVCPHPELIEEMGREAGTEFYMYRSKAFVEGARQHLDVKISQEAVDEVERAGRRAKDLQTLEAMQRLFKDPYFGLRAYDEAWRRQMDEFNRRMLAPQQGLAEFNRRMLAWQQGFADLTQSIADGFDKQIAGLSYKPRGLAREDQMDAPEEEPDESDEESDPGS